MDVLENTKNLQAARWSRKNDIILNEIKDGTIDVDFALQEWESFYRQYDATFDAIALLLKGDDLEPLLDEQAEVEAQFRQTRAVLKNVKRTGAQTPDSVASNHSRDSNSSGSNSSYEKQRLHLPKFSGKRQEWSQYAALFISGIARYGNLQESEKLQFLIDSLSGEARSYVNCYSTQPNAFQQAWAALEERYERPLDNTLSIFDPFLDLPPAKGQSDLPRLYDTVNQALRQLEVCGYKIENSDITWIRLVTKKLDSASFLKWRGKQNQKEKPCLKQLLNFLRKQSEMCPQELSRASTPAATASTSSAPSSASRSKMCPDKTCNLEHHLSRCPSFQKATLDERWEIVKKCNVCTNCLFMGHRGASCPSKANCRTANCTKRHHTTLHREPAKPVTACLQSSGEVLLPTAQVSVCGAHGKLVSLRALLDTAAQTSLITATAALKLGLPLQESTISFTTANGLSYRSSGMVRCTINSKTENFKLPVNLHVVADIAAELPSTPANTASLQRLLTGKQLADPAYHKPAPVDLLIGADFFPALMANEVSTNGTAVAQCTKLGWVVFGNTPAMLPPPPRIVAMSMRNAVSSSFHKFWELEELPAQRHLTPEEKLVESFTQETTERSPDGKFIMRMPLIKNQPPLGASRPMAVARLQALERKFKRAPAFEKDYRAVIKEYIDLGHMEPAPVPAATDRVNYLPHHAVVRESASTTKVRVVFDASAKTSNGTSLNDIQANGPRLQDDIFTILVRFRLHPIALTADISKMYRQVWLHPDDRDLQRIVWRSDPSEPIEDFRLTTVTFGEKAAPYLAIKALQLLAKACDQPATSRVIEKDFYVDDLLSGAENPAAAAALQQSLQATLSSGGFPTHKWASNCQAALVHVPPQDRAVQWDFNQGEDHGIKTLGIRWDPPTDKFSIVVTTPATTKWTRRNMLSLTNSVFDPLGWLSPFTIVAKLQLQRVIKETINWDDPLPADQSALWLEWVSQLQDLAHVHLPRCIVPHTPAVLHLCGFSDASERAYAACVYARSVDEDGSSTIRLIAAKTRVVPLRPVTLPRLELLAAHLLAQLLTAVAAALEVPASNIHAWTDSTVTLAWIRSPAARWQTFVANRVAAIQDTVPPNHWGHVRSADNPADLPSRGLPASQLRHASLWWFGPAWLRFGLDSGSSPKIGPAPEAKKVIPVVAAVTKLHPSVTTLLKAYSSYAKLRRVVARLLQFTDIARKRANPGSLNTQLLARADTAIARSVQQESFPEEIGHLRLGQPVPLKSSLAVLNPNLDDDGLVRVGGRLSRSSLPAPARHPIIMPPHHHVTRLLVEGAHIQSLHGGATLTESILRKRYWVLRPTSTVKNILRRCVICTRHKAKLAQQMMADLPVARVTPSRPFSHCGLDFAGPVLLRTHLARGSKSYKAWIALFVCLSSRAVHLELVTALSTEALHAAVSRFASRRGLPGHIYSDQGTNFVGLAREWKSLLRAAPLQELGLEWHFNPPSAPHFGGLWEAGVKSMKTHLRRVLGTATLNYEEFSTLLCRIEAVMNSRPLLPASPDPASLDVLTPAHFLVGGSLLHPPEEDLTDFKSHTLRRWQLVQKLSQDFWSRWSREYLSRLQSRPKWLRMRANIEVGSLVLIQDPNRLPLDWRLGRVTAIHPGSDDAIRVVTLKTAYGEVQRPIHKLCILPLDGEPVQAPVSSAVSPTPAGPLDLVPGSSRDAGSPSAGAASARVAGSPSKDPPKDVRSTTRKPLKRLRNQPHRKCKK